jgi:hypothetical protein
MITIRTALATVPILLAVGAIGASAAPPPAADAKPPHILEFEYFEDYEGIGRRYNAFATLKGKANRVTARVGKREADARFDGGPGVKKTWDFTGRAFVKKLRFDLEADGRASVKVKAVGDATTVRKVCSLVLERDDQFGDYAGGDCKRV